MAQPPILKAKISDRPALRDLANFVVPQASARWHNLGLQLFDPRDEGVLHSMKMETSKRPEEQCTEVFHHWLTTKKNPTWNKLIKSLKSPAVNLPNVASTIEKMLDSRSFWAKGKHKFKKKFSNSGKMHQYKTNDIHSSRIPTTITEGSSSYESSDGERIDHVEYDESDKEIPPDSPTHCWHMHRTNSVQSLNYKQISMPVGMTDHQFGHKFRSLSMSTASLPATLQSLEIREQKNEHNKKENTNKHRYARNNECENEENELQNEALLQKDRSPEEITEQLKELTKQLNYKEKYEKEQEKLMQQYRQNTDTYKQLMEQCKQNADTYKQLLEKEILRNEEIAKQNEMLNKENMQRLFEELKTEMTKSLTMSEVVYKKELLEKINLMNKEKLNQKVLIDELKKEVAQLKNQLAAYEKQCEGHVNYYKELNEISEKRISEVIDTFSQQIKDTEEVCRKELYNLQVIVEEHRKEIIENKRLRDKQNFLTDKLNKGITQLKNKLTYVQVTEQKDLQFTEKFQESIKKLHCKELNARDEIYEKRINKVIDMFNRQLIDSEKIQRKEFHNLKLEIEEFKAEEVKKLEDSKEACKANSTIMEKLIREEVQNIKGQLKEQKLLIESIITGSNFYKPLFGF